MTILQANLVKGSADRMEVIIPANHAQTKKIEHWLTYLSVGYVEWLLRKGSDPHCSNCSDIACENHGMGDDACKGFKYGEEW